MGYLEGKKRETVVDSVITSRHKADCIPAVEDEPTNKKKSKKNLRQGGFQYLILSNDSNIIAVDAHQTISGSPTSAKLF